MNETLTVTNRRTLSFPAIQPSDEISPPTLLNSLIDLAAEILGHRSKLFTTNNQNARQSIRQTGVLLVFLEELRDSAEEIPYDVVLSFSELHVAFQKLRYLMEDCSLDGARFWMLVKAELIADQFRSLWRSISMAIDVLPMSRIEIDDELKEHVELAKYQARRSRYEVDPDDKRILQIVNAVLTGFESDVIPDKDILRSILDYLKIQTWTKCHKEAKFLDSEMDLENQSKEKSEMSILSSLMGFVCYCRCTLFDSVDEDSVESDRQLAGNLHGGGGDLPVGITEDDLRCPITLETMTDPVTIASGQTFDRASIAKWFAAGNLTCPNTGEKLPTTATVPNSAIKSLITRPGFPGSGHRTTRRVKREPLDPSPAARNAARATAKLLVQSLETGCARQKNKASYEVRALSKTSPFNRACLVGAGAVPPLLNLLGSSNPSSSSSIQENSSAALLNLSKLSETREAIFRSSGLKNIASVLRDKLGSSSETKQHIAGVVFYLASAENLRPLVGEYPEIIPGLVDLIRDGTDRGKRNAMIAIFGLLASQENRPRVVSAGTVSTLVSFLNPTESESELVTDSLAILSILVEDSELIPSCLDPVIRILNCPNSSRTSKELCVSLLLGLCKNGENNEIVSVLAKSGSVMSSLYSILSRGSNRGTKKASALINVLHEFHERRSSSGLMVPMIRQERIVRAW